MAVYREFFKAVELIQANTWTLDHSTIRGAVTNGNDEIWHSAKMLADVYGVKGSRLQVSTTRADGSNPGKMVHIKIRGIDEWAVTDGRMTKEEATVEYALCYFTDTIGVFLDGKRYAGVFFLDELVNRKRKFANKLWEEWERKMTAHE